MKVTTSVKIDKEVKNKASKLCSELGLNLSSIINATLKKFITERRVVFSTVPEFNIKKEKEFLKIMEDIKENKNLAGPFSDMNSLKKSLLK